MINLEGRSWADVIFAEPVEQPLSVRHSSRRDGPAAAWIAPSFKRAFSFYIHTDKGEGIGEAVSGKESSWRGGKQMKLTTPPPPRRELFAALTMEVTSRLVIEV